jgi:glyoxylase-like metal-dependent hydrolase (beta-lactamase superfamily II)
MEEFVTAVHKLDERTYYFDQFDVHIYLFLGQERALLTDTGFGCFPDLKEKVAAITDLPLTVLNSHGHPDHCGGDASFGAIYAHPAGFEAIYHFSEGDFTLLPLEDGEIIDLGGRSFETILTPGHIDGHLALLNRAERILLPGDIVQGDHIVMYLGYGADYAKYRDSLVKLKDMGALYDTILPCHGPVPMDRSQFDRVIACVDAYTAGQLAGKDAVGPEGSACKEFTLDGFSILA